MMQIGSALPRLSEEELLEIRIEELLEHYQEDLTWVDDDGGDDE